MKKLKLFPLLITSLLGVTTLTGCAIDLFEDELNVVFMNEGQIVDNGVITQFKNFRTPELDEAYVPTDYRFLGWTAYDYSELDLQDATHFKTQYIMAGRMVHYMEAKPFAVNRTTVYTALILHKDEIPKDYHYAVIAWYDKESTTGINSGEMKTLINKTKDYLHGKGVSDADLKTLVFRSYTGNVGPSCGQIMYDGDVDIMLGWGSIDNVTGTGGMPAAMLLESKQFKVTYQGSQKTRWLHRLTASEASIDLMAYFQTEEVYNIFNPEA